MMNQHAKDYLEDLKEKRRRCLMNLEKDEIQMEDAVISLKALENILKCEDLIRYIEII